TPVLVAADFSSITDDAGTRVIETYQNLPGRRFATLTRREADLVAVANPGSRAPTALEDIHPWLPSRPFLNNSAASFALTSAIVRRYRAHMIPAADYCDEKWNTICNSVRRTS